VISRDVQRGQGFRSGTQHARNRRWTSVYASPKNQISDSSTRSLTIH
jgi:hypothetical protein